MPMVILPCVILALAFAALVVILGSSVPLKYHLAAEVAVSVAGLLAAALLGANSYFWDIWPDGPESSHALVMAKAAGIGLATLSPFAIVAFLIDRHRRAKL